MVLPAALLLLGALTAVVAPRPPARADWADREPVLALWVWLGVPLWGAEVFAPAPNVVVEAYTLGTAEPWAAATAVALACGGV